MNPQIHAALLQLSTAFYEAHNATDAAIERAPGVQDDPQASLEAIADAIAHLREVVRCMEDVRP